MTLLALVILTILVSLNNNDAAGIKTKAKVSSSTESATVTFTKSAEETPIETPSPSSISTTTSAKIQNSLPTAPPAPTDKPNNMNTDEWIYPGSNIKSKTDNSLSLESNENSTTITSWYKAKLNSGDFSAKSFALTSANDNVLNKMSAAGTGKKIEIEIQKSPNEAYTKIKVDLNLN